MLVSAISSGRTAGIRYSGVGDKWGFMCKDIWSDLMQGVLCFSLPWHFSIAIMPGSYHTISSYQHLLSSHLWYHPKWLIPCCLAFLNPFTSIISLKQDTGQTSGDTYNWLLSLSHSLLMSHHRPSSVLTVTPFLQKWPHLCLKAFHCHTLSQDWIPVGLENQTRFNHVK